MTNWAHRAVGRYITAKIARFISIPKSWCGFATGAKLVRHRRGTGGGHCGPTDDPIGMLWLGVSPLMLSAQNIDSGWWPQLVEQQSELWQV